MFKTLFLLSALAALFIIAFKGPDQTPLQFAGEITRTAETFLTSKTLVPATNNMNKDNHKTENKKNSHTMQSWEQLTHNLQENFAPKKTDSSLQESQPKTQSISPKPVVTNNNTTQLTADPDRKKIKLPVEQLVKKLPPLKVIEVPERPTLSISESNQSLESKPKHNPKHNLRKIENYYENASRLLLEIQ